MSSKTRKNKKAPRGPPDRGDNAHKSAPKVKPKAKVGWEWQAFTTKAVMFNMTAQKLDQHIKMMYGPNVSITQYEKFCIAATDFTDQEVSLARPYKSGIALLTAYHNAKEERDAERRTFRSDVEVTDIQGTMASLTSKFGGSDFESEIKETQGEVEKIHDDGRGSGEATQSGRPTEGQKASHEFTGHGDRTTLIDECGIFLPTDRNRKDA